MTRHAAPVVWLGLDLGWAYRSLLPAIWRSTKCMHRAQDVLHDAFLRYAVHGRHESILQPHAYLRVVARSLLADQMAHEKRFVAFPDLDQDADPVGLSNSPRWPTGIDGALTVPSAEALVDLQQRLIAVQRAIDGLPPRCRDVFWLCRMEGHTQPEIAAKLGISLNMVERHMMRALLHLRAARDLLPP